MTTLLHAIFLISGTAIGAGLVALPLTVVHLGLHLTALLLGCALFVAYRSSMMTIDLCAAKGEASSIVDLSRYHSGNKAAVVSMISFYSLSLALLTVYFSCLTSTLESASCIPKQVILFGCSCALFLALSLKEKLFSQLSTLLVTTLLIIIAACIGQFLFSKNGLSFSRTGNVREVITVIPILFTSFGVQNICANIYGQLNGDKKHIERAFLIGITIPAVIYLVWIVSVLGNVGARDPAFLEKMRQHQVSVGELIVFLCGSTNIAFMSALFQALSLFAITTSAIGIGLGLQKSLDEVLPSSRYGSRLCVCAVPALVCLTVQNAFLKILSFGAMTAVVFVIFMPFYLKRKRGRTNPVGEWIALGAGILVVLCELYQLTVK